MLKSMGKEYKYINNADQYNGEKILIMPGVGSFSNVVSKYREKEFDLLIESVVKKNLKVIGLCLGMQLLCTYSEEGGGAEGLNLIKGRVIKFDEQARAVPNIGWRRTETNSGEIVGWYYYTHSYHVTEVDKNNIWLKSENGIQLISGIRKNNIFGVQFHPEKSNKYGRYFFENILKD